MIKYIVTLLAMLFATSPVMLFWRLVSWDEDEKKCAVATWLLLNLLLSMSYAGVS